MAISVGGWGSTSITTNGWGGGAIRVELVLWLSADYLGKRTDPSTQRRKPDTIPTRSAGAGGE